jgi:hypothetical protein
MFVPLIARLLLFLAICASGASLALFLAPLSEPSACYAIRSLCRVVIQKLHKNEQLTTVSQSFSPKFRPGNLSHGFFRLRPVSTLQCERTACIVVDKPTVLAQELLETMELVAIFHFTKLTHSTTSKLSRCTPVDVDFGGIATSRIKNRNYNG